MGALRVSVFVFVAMHCCDSCALPCNAVLFYMHCEMLCASMPCYMLYAILCLLCYTLPYALPCYATVYALLSYISLCTYALCYMLCDTTLRYAMLCYAVCRAQYAIICRMPHARRYMPETMRFMLFAMSYMSHVTIHRYMLLYGAIWCYLLYPT